MNREDIIRMAREAGFSGQDGGNTDLLAHFAYLVAAAEREECANVCVALAERASQDHLTSSEQEYESDFHYGREEGADECAAAIRARGNTNG